MQQHVREYFHPGFVAKRMELGAGRCGSKNVVREKPEAGDVIILLGGKTDDGVGGATGSSKVQTVELLKQLVLRFKRECHRRT
ncbi:MAG: hypothetical protein ACLUSV_06180 [Streptococcus sp.]